VIILALVAGAESVLIWRQYHAAPDQPYAFGSWLETLQNLAIYGWWLLTPGPLFAPRLTLPMTLAGWAFWLLWGTWGIWNWKRGYRWPAACCLSAILILAPALPLDAHVFPYLALLAAASGVLTLVALLPATWQPRPRTVWLLIALALAASWGSMTYRLKARDPSGLPADPFVQRTAISYEAIQTLQTLPPDPEGQAYRYLIILQPPPAGPTTELAVKLGDKWVFGSPLNVALAKEVGPILVLGDSLTVRWANDLHRAPPEAFVLADGGARLRPWGPLHQALLYQSLTEVARGQFTRARAHLLRAAQLSDAIISFFYDRSLMIVPATAVQARAPQFLEFLAAETATDSQVAEATALQEIFQELLQVCGADLQPSP
jgi:hypothetical protein